MANTYRGEVDVILAGKTYAVALTLSAIARIAGEWKVETLDQFEGRLRELRIADMAPFTRALLDANGHTVPGRDIETIGARQYTATVTALWNARPMLDDEPAGEAGGGADPQTRAA